MGKRKVILLLCVVVIVCVVGFVGLVIYSRVAFKASNKAVVSKGVAMISSALERCTHIEVYNSYSDPNSMERKEEEVIVRDKEIMGQISGLISTYLNTFISVEPLDGVAATHEYTIISIYDGDEELGNLEFIASSMLEVEILEEPNTYSNFEFIMTDPRLVPQVQRLSGVEDAEILDSDLNRWTKFRWLLE